jgi:hypothetical protein
MFLILVPIEVNLSYLKSLPSQQVLEKQGSTIFTILHIIFMHFM